MTREERARALELARDAVSLQASERALVDATIAELLATPHLYTSLGASDDLGVARLEGLVNLRMQLAHAGLDPLDVGEARARETANLVDRFFRAELAVASELARANVDDDVDLTYQTLLALHPPPPYRLGADAPHVPVPHLPALLERWEERHRRPRGAATWIRQKWKQNVQFFRAYGLLPLYLARMLRIRRYLPARAAANPGMRDTFHALEQLGPILDNFVFDRGVGATFRDATAICDLAFLYMQLADELVDNLVKLADTSGMLRLLARRYAPEDRSRIFIPLEDLGADDLRAIGVDPDAPIVKYGVTVAHMVATLAELRTTLEARIAAAKDADSVRAHVREFFHHCFATFLDELHLPSVAPGVPLDRLPLADVAWHFHRKNNGVMTRWLAIRARLLGLDPADHADAIATWGYVLANFQIFDDMKDVAVDLGHQPSYPLAIAWHCFPTEYKHMALDLAGKDTAVDRNDVPQLNVRTPRTVLECIRWSRLVALAFFDWFTFYVWDYRWRRNWLLRARSFHLPPEGGDVPIGQGALARFSSCIDTGVPVVDAAFRYVAATSELASELSVGDEYLAFVLDVIGYDHDGAVYRALLPRLGTIYRFMNLRMRMPPEEKAEVLRRVLAVHEKAAIEGLVGLRLATGSGAFAHEVARALRLPLPAAPNSLPRERATAA